MEYVVTLAGLAVHIDDGGGGYTLIQRGAAHTAPPLTVLCLVPWCLLDMFLLSPGPLESVQLPECLQY
jgi:hypothetical protein